MTSTYVVKESLGGAGKIVRKEVYHVEELLCFSFSFSVECRFYLMPEASRVWAAGAGWSGAARLGESKVPRCNPSGVWSFGRCDSAS